MHPTLIRLPSVIVGERVVLRPYRRGDGPALFDAIDSSRKRLAPWLHWTDNHRSRDDSEHFARRAQARWLLREDLMVGVWHRDGRLLGGSGLHDFDWNTRAFEVGYWLRDEAVGCGYVREAVRLLAALAFVRLSAIRVKIACDARNLSSASVPRALQFVAEAVLHNHQVDDAGEMRDTLVFAHTPDSYRAVEWRGDAESRLAASDDGG